MTLGGCLSTAAVSLALAAPGPKLAERYVLKSFPSAGGGPRLEENVAAYYASDGSGTRYSGSIVSEGRDEEVSIRTDTAGRLEYARRDIKDGTGKTLSSEQVSVRGDSAEVERRTGGRTRTTRIRLRQGMELAVDASLLILLRREDFSAPFLRKFFMIDFSGRSITVTAANLGPETVEVPAGRVECFRVEVTVGIPILKPRITYWLSRKAPHFLVRHEGKRGPFTKTYTTVLVH